MISYSYDEATLTGLSEVRKNSQGKVFGSILRSGDELRAMLTPFLCQGLVCSIPEYGPGGGWAPIRRHGRRRHRAPGTGQSLAC